MVRGETTIAKMASIAQKGYNPRMEETKYFDGMTTPIGRIHIVVSAQALVRIHLPNERWSERYTRRSKHPLIRRVKKELAEYFAGKRTAFSIPLKPLGTDFELRAWRALSRIPYGNTVSYQEEARRMGRPKAVRAVGNANGKNPIPIVIPCHRVVRGTGALGGYAGGLTLKKRLLALEMNR